MKKRIKFTAVALIALMGASAAQAQIPKQQPAEFPPASYKGKQYVDSNGCVFIRAGIDGDVSWVPRVTRERKTVCGFEPSLGVRAAAVPEPEGAPEEEIVVTEEVVAPAAEVAAAPVAQPEPRVVVAPTAAPRPTRQPTAVPRVAQRKPVVAAPRPQPVAPVRRSAVVQYDPSAVTATTRIAPKHVVENRANTQNVSVPHGYKRVWEDGRLNPKRAEQNLQGRGDMLLIWTQTVPRRLIDRRSGRDVTASVPLVYPYTSVAQQRRALGEVKIVQRNGQIVKRVLRNQAATTAYRQPVYSSRSAPAKPKAAKPARKVAVAHKSYVQIGTFKSQSNAQKAAKQIARMGMPARIGKHRKGGKRYLTVQAGPFKTSRGMARALRDLRGVGYKDAFARN